jgi:hypothetical protein
MHRICSYESQDSGTVSYCDKGWWYWALIPSACLVAVATGGHRYWGAIPTATSVVGLNTTNLYYSRDNSAGLVEGPCDPPNFSDRGPKKAVKKSRGLPEK